MTNAQGQFILKIPFAKQQKNYNIIAKKEGYETSFFFASPFQAVQTTLTKNK
jgi:hypothetical protein